MKMKKVLKKYYRHILILVLLALVVTLSTDLSLFRAVYFPINLERPVGMQIFSEMIGETRTILASYIYIRADMYHHERQERINWKKDPATLPLYRLITTLDPRMEKAYDFGAYHLAVNFKKYDEGIKFLQEGMRYNPDSFILHFTMGDIFYMKGDYETAARYFRQALDLFDTEVDVRNCLRRLYWTNRKLKNYDQAEKYVVMWYKLDPDYELVKRLAKELHQLKTGEKTEEDFERAKMSKEEKEKAEKMLQEKMHEEHHRHHHDHHHDNH